MKSLNLQSKLLFACMALISAAVLLKADYYKPNFFPIGLTGLNHTGYDTTGRGNPCPYGNVDLLVRWTWDNGTQSEKALIYSLGVNCIGCSDAYPPYFLHMTNQSVTNNYLHKVCNDSILLIPAIYQADIKYYECDSNLLCQYYTGDSLSCYQNTFWRPPGDSCIKEGSYSRIRPSSFFRSPHRPPWGGFGSMLFTMYNSGKEGKTGGTGCHGSYEYNWSSFDGDSLWRIMADHAVNTFDTFYSSGYIDKVWGWNLMAEGPAIYNKDVPNDIWLQGAWAAVDRVFNGSNTIYQDSIPHWDTDGHRPGHTGIRGIEDSLSLDHRMIVAKGGLAVLHRANLDIFKSLPDIDVFVDHWHGWCTANYNYGEQGVFDHLLYNPDANLPGIAGYHNNAIYFQKYGQNHLAYSDQKRRWVPYLALEWNAGNAYKKRYPARRPCPPEIRCAAYLLMSRGAKGILFHGWSFPINHNLWPGSELTIPNTSYWEDGGNVGIRDHYGYPFGDSNSDGYSHHWLNAGVGGSAESTYWHGDGRRDRTYDYLCDLIPELKKITPTLVHLDWVNAYSLKSTVTGKGDDCPHMYVKDITTNREGYIDLAFFDHPDESSSEYFMVVNRDGIAEMDTSMLQIALDGSRWSNNYGGINRLIVKNMADTADTFVLTPSNGYIFTDIFAPGEGKLYRVKGGEQYPGS